MHSVLLVEDNLHKKERTQSFIAETFPNLTLQVASSFTSACRSITEHTFDLAILDMSLPTFDKSQTESGGRFRTFGGREVARKIVRKKIPTGIVFLTQYPNFRDEFETYNLDTLASELRRECGDNYLGLVHYDSSKLDWKTELTQIIEALNEHLNR